MPDQNPATELRTAATALRDPDADACQHPNCGCPDELHRRDADGASWCTDCDDQHPYRPAPAFAIPEQLRGPLADWLEREARHHDATVQAAAQVFGDDETARDRWIAEQTNGEALAVARQLLGGPS